MDIVIFNISWISFNLVLAIIPVTLGLLMYYAKPRILRLFIGIIWLLFLPNTIYLITDLVHISKDWGEVGDIGKLILLTQYSLLATIGIITFILALYPFEKMSLHSQKLKKDHGAAILIGLNLLIGFGIALGRVERIHSWYVFTDPIRVLNSGLRIIQTPELFFGAVIFGIFSYFLYRVSKKSIIAFFSFDKY